MSDRNNQNENQKDNDYNADDTESHEIQDQEEHSLYSDQNINDPNPEITEAEENSNSPNQNLNLNAIQINYTQQNVENQPIEPGPLQLSNNQNPEQNHDQKVNMTNFKQQNVKTQSIDHEPKKIFQVIKKEQEKEQEESFQQELYSDIQNKNNCNKENDYLGMGDQEMNEEKKVIIEENQNDANTENINEDHKPQEPPQNEIASEMDEEINEGNDLVQTLNNDMELEENENTNDETITVKRSEESGNSNVTDNIDNNNNNNIHIPRQSWGNVLSQESIIFGNSSNNMDYDDQDERLNENIELPQFNIIRIEYDQNDPNNALNTYGSRRNH
jgi:hypothetical protein